MSRPPPADPSAAERADLYRTIFECLPGGALLCDGDGRLLEANRQACDLLACSPGELVGRRLAELVFSEKPGDETAAPTEPVAGLRELRRTDGRRVPVEIRVRALGNDRFLHTLEEVEGRQQTNAFWLRDRSVLHTIAESMDDGLLVVSAGDRIIHRNRRFLELWSIPEALISAGEDRTLLGYVATQLQDPEGFLRRVREIYRSADRVEDTLHLKDGRIFDRVSYPLPQTSGQEVERLWIFRDVTERKREEVAVARRLVALSPPLNDPTPIGFEDLFNLEELQQIQDAFAVATGVSSIITRPNGEPITRASNFCRLCSDIIRQTPLGRCNCQASDAALGRHHPAGPIVQPCLSGGLWDAGASITIGGHHVASWLIGQVRDSTQSEDQMRAYAREIGADPETMVAAFREVPAMPRAQFEQAAQALFLFANQLSRTAYQNLQQARFIAERERAEAALQANLRELQWLMRSMANAFAVWGVIYDDQGRLADLRFDYINATYEKITGRTLADVQGRMLREIWPETESAWFDHYGEVARTGVTRTFELAHGPTGGVYACTAYRPGDTADRICCVFEEVTERRRAERALQASERKLAEIFRSSPEMIVVTHRSTGLVLDVNAACLRMLGYSRNELVGRTTAEIDVWQSPEVRARVVGLVPESGSVAQNLEVQFRRKDGSLLDVSLSMAMVVLDGEPCLLTIAADLTERKRAEQERLELERRLLHAQKLESLGVLAGGIAHDFNNLLMAILGNLDLALLDLPVLSPARTSVEQGVIAARRAADLTRQMLAYSGKGGLQPVLLDLSRLVEENGHLFRTCISKIINLQLHLEPALPAINADAGQVQQVIMNLITNAAEAIGDRAGLITLATGVQDCTADYLRRGRVEETPAAGRFVFLEVSDTGCGMDAETQRRLFEPFFTTKFTGRGLGMAALLGIVRGHHGTILVDSTVGRGTTIRVLFPATNATAPTPSQSPKVMKAAVRKRVGSILLVDDEDMVRAVCQRMLRQEGWEVIAAANGPEAIALFRTQAASITCVLLDLSMPGMDGLAVFRELRAIRPDIKVILSSGYSSDRRQDPRLANEDFASFIQKPYTAEALRNELARVVDSGTGNRPVR